MEFKQRDEVCSLLSPSGGVASVRRSEGAKLIVKNLAILDLQSIQQVKVPVVSLRIDDYTLE